MTTAHAQQACTARTLHDAPCKAFALPGRTTCAVHDPERAGAVRAARAKGGQVRAIQGRRRRLDSPDALARFTANIIQDVVDGSTPVDVARVVLYGLGVQRQLVEIVDLERRIVELERRLGPTVQGGQRW